MPVKQKYLVVFDTSTLYGMPIRDAILTFIKNYSKDTRVDISFAIPEVVKLEQTKHYIDDLIKAKTQYETATRDLRKLIGYTFLDVKFDLKNGKQKMEALLKKNNITIIPTPYKWIDFEKLIIKAVNYESPFQEGKEKGFKDSIIIGTIIYHLSKLKTGTQVIFVCSDNHLREYASSLTSKYKQLGVYESIVDFETELKLHLLKVDEEFIKRLTQEAAFAFYDNTNPDALFWKEKLRSKVYTKYKNLIEYPDVNRYIYGMGDLGNYGTSYIPIESGRYNIASPAFVNRKTENIFEWSSTIVFERAYHRTNSSWATVPSWGVRNVNKIVYYTLEFNILWETEVGADEKVKKSKLLDIKHKNTSVRTDEELTPWGYAQAATINPLPTTSTGQGTVAVSTILEEKK